MTSHDPHDIQHVSLREKGLLPAGEFDRKYLISLVQLFQGRLPRLNDFLDRADFFFIPDITPEPQAREKYLSKDRSREFRLFVERLEKLERFDLQTIEAAFRQIVQELGIEAKELIHPIRVALTGKTVGPGLFEVIYYLGKERTKTRLMKWVERSG